MKKKIEPVGAESKQRCPHCNKPLRFGRQKSTGRRVFACQTCRCTFKPMGLTIEAQAHAIHILRKHLDYVLDTLERYEQEILNKKLTAKQARDLLQQLQDEVLPIVTRNPCPRCGSQEEASTNCIHCYGTGYNTNL